MDTFSCTTRIYFGENAMEALAPLAGKRVLIVTDGFLADSGLLAAVTKRLGSAVLALFREVTPDPSLALVARGVAQLRAFGPEAIVAFGGGSPMDCAKGMRYFAGCDAPLYAIPTTAGTGSEVTSFAVLTDTDRGVKHPLTDQRLLPQAAILDPSLLAGVPPAVTADTGLDVLSHAAEAYVARNATPFTDALACHAFSLALEHLPRAHSGDPPAKAQMLLASTLAGLAFDRAGLGLCHALSHTLGGTLHLPHGRLNAILLPRVILLNGAGPAAGKYARLAALCGLSPTPRALAAALTRLAVGLGEPQRLGEKIDCNALAAAAQKDPCAATNPIEVPTAALAALLREVS